MCYIYGSVDQAVNACPMCKVFPHARCPHVREICRNRTAHPRCDVLYLKNAEVECFNGCGYCKWARVKPPSNLAGWNNPGWPGCCRPPAPAEHRFIQIADWKSINVIYGTTIPPEISAALAGLQRRGNSPVPPRPVPGHSRPTHERRGSTTSPPTKPVSPTSSGKSTVRGRSSGSPQLHYHSTNPNISRSSSVTTIASSVSNSPGVDYKRQDHVDRTHPSRSSPSRKHADLDTTKRSGSTHGRRPSVTPATTSVSVSNVNADGRAISSQPSRHKASLSTSSIPSAKSPPPRAGDRPSFTVPRTPKKDDDDTSSASSSSGSDGMLSDCTVTSDGAFTDYLSDESEAELQRQAEARAALLAQSQAEELEFKAARQQLAHIDLRPPKAWNSINLHYGSSVRLPAGSAPYSPNIPISNATRS